MIVFEKPHSLADVPLHYCPGCTHGIIHRLVAEVIDELEIEWLIMNDGSTDKSAEILADYAKKDNRIKIISQENSGPGVASNRALSIAHRINNYYYEKMVGQRQLGTSLLISMIINGHILIESVPGLAKTTAAKTMTEAVNGRFSRIQCTPDLLPSDIIGTQILNYSTNTFDTKLGPVHANFVLLDEINRSSAKTQSAMLEVMQEHQTTIGGENYPVPEIFMVIATQNPIEQEGTYVLSEAQLDRFAIKEKLEYPTEDEEVLILNRVEADVFSKGAAVVGLDSVKYLQDLVKKVYIDDAVKKYIVSLVDATRHPADFISPVPNSLYSLLNNS